MKITVDKHSFSQAFENMGRGKQFSRDGLDALFEELDALDSDMELDVVAICCEWSEYATAKEAAEDGGWEAPERDENEEDDDYEERVEDEALEYLRDRTHVIQHGSGVIVQAF